MSLKVKLNFASKDQEELQEVNGIKTEVNDDVEIISDDDSESTIPPLPEGTVVVYPEPVEEKKPTFKGPEFKSSTRKRAKTDGGGGASSSKVLENLFCTACGRQINPWKTGMVKKHKELKVIICRKCYNFLGSGEIGQDDDGMDEQCRWCGEGGRLTVCDKCPHAFCKGCIMRNFGRGAFTDVTESKNWDCYCCDPSPLEELRKHSRAVHNAISSSKAGSSQSSQPAESASNSPRPTPSRSRPSSNTRSQSTNDPESLLTTLATNFDLHEDNVVSVTEKLAESTSTLEHMLQSVKLAVGSGDVAENDETASLFSFSSNTTVEEKKQQCAKALKKELQTFFTSLGQILKQENCSIDVKSASLSKSLCNGDENDDLSKHSSSKSSSLGVSSRSRSNSRLCVEKSESGSREGKNKDRKISEKEAREKRAKEKEERWKEKEKLAKRREREKRKEQKRGKKKHKKVEDSEDEEEEKETKRKRKIKTEKESDDSDSEEKGKERKKRRNSRKKTTENTSESEDEEQEREIKQKKGHKKKVKKEETSEDEGNRKARKKDKASKKIKKETDDSEDEERDSKSKDKKCSKSSNKKKHSQGGRKSEVSDDEEEMEVDDINGQSSSESRKKEDQIEKSQLKKPKPKKTEKKTDEDAAQGNSEEKDTLAPVSDSQDLSQQEENLFAKLELIQELAEEFCKDSSKDSSEVEKETEKGNDKKAETETENNTEAETEKENDKEAEREKENDEEAKEDNEDGIKSDDEFLPQISFGAAKDESNNSEAENDAGNEKATPSKKHRKKQANTESDLSDAESDKKSEKSRKACKKDSELNRKRKKNEAKEDAGSPSKIKKSKGKAGNKKDSAREADATRKPEDADGGDVSSSDLFLSSDEEDRKRPRRSRVKKKQKKSADGKKDDGSASDDSSEEADKKKKTKGHNKSPSKKSSGKKQTKSESDGEDEDSAADGKKPKKKAKKELKSKEKAKHLEKEISKLMKASSQKKKGNDKDDEGSEDEGEAAEGKESKKNAKKELDSEEEAEHLEKEVSNLLKGAAKTQKKKDEDEEESDENDKDEDMDEDGINEDGDEDDKDEDVEATEEQKPKKKSKKRPDSAEEAEDLEKEVSTLLKDASKTKKKKDKGDEEGGEDKDEDGGEDDKGEDGATGETKAKKKAKKELDSEEEDERLEKEVSGLLKGAGKTKKKKDKDEEESEEDQEDDDETAEEEKPKKKSKKKEDSEEEDEALEENPSKLLKGSGKTKKTQDDNDDKTENSEDDEEDKDKNDEENEDDDAEDISSKGKKQKIKDSKVKAEKKEKKAKKGKSEDESSDSSDDDKNEDGDEDEDMDDSDEEGLSKASEDLKKKKKMQEESADLENELAKAAMFDELDDDNEAEDDKNEEEEDSSSSESDVGAVRKRRAKKPEEGKEPLSKKGQNLPEEEDNSDTDVEPTSARKRLSFKSKLLDAKVSDSGSDSDIKRPKKGKKRKRDSDDESYDGEKSKDGDDDDDDGGDSVIDSDEVSSDEDFSDDSTFGKRKGKQKGKKGKGKGKDKGKKRKRIKKMDSSSEEDGDDDKEGEEPGSRKKIRKIKSDKKLDEGTRAAARAEEERRKRVVEKQKKFNGVETKDAGDGQAPITTKLVLEQDGETKEPLIQVNPKLICKLKPHQVEAVQFMWDCLFESLERCKKNESSAGCILAHCMGLGKTLSVVAFVHTLMTHKKLTKVKRCLVVSPLNTVLNWENEFSIWLDEKDQLEVYELSSVKQNHQRADLLEEWYQDGGIMIIGYEMMRNLSQGLRVKNKKLKAIFHKTLSDPGPDIVVCDEGHLMKNAATAISKSINQIKTRRRVVLTGTPLQNNLIEYHCMVDFVKHNLLGTKKEFANRFVNPIINGQHSDSTGKDVRVMKQRAHVLHELLAGCVQRRDYSALTKFLPPKQEYVISVRLSEMQMSLYEEYLNRSGQVDGQITSRGARLFKDYQNLMRIWTHPWVLKLAEIRDDNKSKFDDEDSFIDDEDTDRSFNSSSSSESESHSASGDSAEEGTSSGRQSKRLRKKKSGSDREEVVNDWKTKSRSGEGGERQMEVVESGPQAVSGQWWAEYVKEEDQNKMERSGKLMLLFDILRMCEEIGDKVLIFSQSLLSLDIIEYFLEQVDSKFTEETQNQPDEELKEQFGKRWIKGDDYFRLDGSTSAQMRQHWASIFNDPDNLQARLFLISTRAGGLGINLVGANRVIIFDASWNPSHDVQSIFRVYRFGQTKPCYIYRFLAQGTMEEKIYDRQVTKLSLSQRVVDEHQVERHFTAADLGELYAFRPERLSDDSAKKTLMLPKDVLLAEIMSGEQKAWFVSLHEHDSLLENLVEQELTEDEKKAAWEEYENDKKGLNINVGPAVQGAGVGVGSYLSQEFLLQTAQTLREKNPNMSQELLQSHLQRIIMMQIRQKQEEQRRLEMMERQQASQFMQVHQQYAQLQQRYLQQMGQQTGRYGQPARMMPTRGRFPGLMAARSRGHSPRLLAQMATPSRSMFHGGAAAAAFQNSDKEPVEVIDLDESTDD